VTETVRKDQAAAVYRGIRKGDGRAVMIKALGSAGERLRDRERLENEYRIESSLDTPSAVRPLAFEADPTAPALILEDNGEESLDGLLGVPLDLDQFLRIAIGIAAALAEVHAHGVVHKNIKPESILVQRATGEVKLTDFELSSRLPREQPNALSPRLIEGSLPYMSPEQTGRTSHALDYRTDLYSLGVTLHQLRAGKLPFAAEDPLGWIHCHLARTPLSLSETIPGTPEVLAAIVAKLLAKVPDERYQSALGLRLDLERCLERLTADGQIAPFALGERDLSDRFQVPERLYGRERQLAQLISAFEEVIASGRPALMLVSGYAGVGKSALIREMHKPIVRERGLFLAGKFDQAKQGIPYSTLSQALGGMIEGLLAEPEEEQAKWRREIQQAVGLNAQLVVDLIPELQGLIGTPPAAPVLPLDESERRFRFVFRQFLGVFARREHPLVLFLDDLHWADTASLRLVEYVLSDSDTQYLLVLGAYRDNEVGPTHPLLAMVEAVKQTRAAVSQVILQPLSRDQVLELVIDTVRRPRRDAEPLAALIDDKTAGNPLFAIHLLTSLHAEGLIRFDAETATWRWDLETIGARRFSDDLVELMVRTLRRLPAPTLAALEMAAILGSTFELETLAMIRGQSPVETERDLWEAGRAGVVLRSERLYRFLHDRVQQAALSLIPDERRRLLHLEIGRALYAHTPAERLAERIFDIVNQINQGVGLVGDPAERERMAELNLIAGQKARSGAAWGAAIRYLDVGMALLPTDAWERRYELAYAIHLERAQCEYLNQAFDEAEALLTTILERCRTVPDRAAPYCVALQLHVNRGRVDVAVGLTIEYLRLCGIEVSPTPSREQVESEGRRVLALLGDRPIESLIDLPPMSDAASAALAMVVSAVVPAAYLWSVNLWALLICQLVRVTLERGNGDYAANIYVSFGSVLGTFFGRHRDGYRFGNLALRLLEKQGLAAPRAQVFFNFGFTVSYWTEPIEKTIPYVEAAFRVGMETGDLTYACGAGAFLLHALLTKGDRLADVQRESERLFDFVQHHRFDYIAADIVTSQWFIQTLRGRGNIDEREHERCIARVWPMFVCWYHIRRLQACVIFGDYAGAQAAAERARPLLWTSLGLLQAADFVFYDALTQAQTSVQQGLAEHERQLCAWADNCPANFLDRAMLVSAELARLDSRPREAMGLYERAIAQARDRGFVHHQALACELAARFYEQQGSLTAARACLQEARACYLRWGAAAKVRQLDERHPELALQSEPSGAMFAAAPAELDLMSVIKASQTISGEVVFEELLRTLVRVMMEQGGAQRGALILLRGGQLTIVAKATTHEAGVRVKRLPVMPIELSRLPPDNILRQVAHTGAPIILNDPATNVGPFTADESDDERKPRSVLCLPIVRQAKTVGYLYLENALVSGAFTQDRLAALEVLAAQAAISLENASLLEATEASRARAAFLAEAGALMAESLDYERVLSRVSELVVQSLADWCEFYLRDGDQIRRRAGTHADPGKRALLGEMSSRYPLKLDSQQLLAEVMRTGDGLLFSEVTDSLLHQQTVDDEHARLVRELGLGSTIVVPLHARERVLGVLMLASAIPGRYGAADLELAEELARRAAMSIDNALLYGQAREAIHLRDEFLCVASHELKTPITSLMLSLEVLLSFCARGPVEPATLAKQLDKNLRQGQRLQRLVGDLLDTTRLETGQLGLERSEVDLVELVREVIDRFELELRRARCQVRFEAPTPVRGFWDHSRLDQVVSNLLSNAIKFGPGHPIEIVVVPNGDRAELSVADHGIGIDPARLGTVFDRFMRGVPDTHYGGLGLGLYISRQIVELHGGTIRVRSQPGAGATFTVDLPTRPH